MLATLNITSINLGQSMAHSPYALQMSPPPNLEAEAMVQVSPEAKVKVEIEVNRG